MGLILLGSGEEESGRIRPELERSNGAKAIAVQTRRGNEINNTQFWEVQPHFLYKLEQMDEQCFRAAGQTKIQRRRATGIYNCHGMTFACRRTGIHETIDVERILLDDGYIKIDDSNVGLGDVVLYHTNNLLSHSGIVISVDEILSVAMILSKWNSGGEYIHPVHVCPYFKGAKVTYYREAQDATEPIPRDITVK